MSSCCRRPSPAQALVRDQRCMQHRGANDGRVGLRRYDAGDRTVMKAILPWTSPTTRSFFSGGGQDPRATGRRGADQARDRAREKTQRGLGQRTGAGALLGLVLDVDQRKVDLEAVCQRRDPVDGPKCAALRGEGRVTAIPNRGFTDRLVAPGFLATMTPLV